MWTNPNDVLEVARRRQRDLARDLDAMRTPTSPPAPALRDVTRSWLIAARTTTRYVLSFVTG